MNTEERKAWLEAADDCIEQVTVTRTCDICGGEYDTIVQFDWVNACDNLDAPPDVLRQLLSELEQERAEAAESSGGLCEVCEQHAAAEYERQVSSDWYYDRI